MPGHVIEKLAVAVALVPPPEGEGKETDGAEV
jgi:hypothetical protein